MFAGESQVTCRVEEHVNCRRNGSTTAVPQHDDQLQTVAQVINCEFQAAENFRAQAVAGHADNKKVVWPFVEDEFDRCSGIRTTDDRGEWALFRRSFSAGQETEVARIDRDDPLNTSPLLCESLKQRSECAIAIVKPAQCSFAVGRARPRVRIVGSVPICDVDRLHDQSVSRMVLDFRCEQHDWSVESKEKQPHCCFCSNTMRSTAHRMSDRSCPLFLFER